MSVSPDPDGIPPVDAVVAAFASRLSGDEPRQEGRVMAMLLELHGNNVAQWEQEDAARRSDGDDAAVAAAKRAIDGLNANRHELLEGIDDAVVTVLRPSAGAPPCTETPAMAYDRLSVLVTRISFTRRAAARQPDDYAARLRVLDAQLAVLQEAVDVLIDELRSGRKRFVPYRSLKLYGPTSAQ
ncbi:MAG TPA: DUF4254 domain-containing protein [Acidimicrobiia bacterium]|jgi:hypothetical protein